jgi:hypothetical protein
VRLGHRLLASLSATAVAFTASLACAQSLPPGAEDCVARIRQLSVTAPKIDVEPNAPPAAVPVLGDVCPEYAAALAESPWGDALAGVLPDELGTSAFVELTTLVASYERAASNAHEPSVASLDDVLAELKLDEPVATPSFWERIRMWIDEHFGAGNAVTPKWLSEWLERLSPSERVVRYLVIGLGTVLVAATVVIVLNELRVAGLLAGGVFRKYAPLGPAAPEPGRPSVRDWDAIVRAPLARRPALLLAIVLDRLRERGKAPRDSLTHRELLRATTGLDTEQSAAFAAIVAAAERVTFGGWQPAESDLDGVLARGRALLVSFATDKPGTR